MKMLRASADFEDLVGQVGQDLVHAVSLSMHCSQTCNETLPIIAGTGRIAGPVIAVEGLHWYQDEAYPGGASAGSRRLREARV